ncbi:Malate/lactate/ureidoglycolate dehydrogenase, LDH2 family [Tistlia consotensis]|uniref:Malate/lactate/ureidoglycolate dehydrogenase, LDH2 family n=1 Tax=Tistlia consotensis USBA 355 TaxID=560819 RepID=A0A1Y6CBJ1_9PROT|nr:Ldh family oxidoreductase [Tistlia consotensis]SMF55494.1 Malate/lactate/ureidoglycolate dehydrogenase, LDH2 family [Tistlia consotensis USBA 355]SNR88556.1 Malate/lactate/ureidoglycolate dehydrogenase, LDH2 family [Tistlia consotensis]
MSAAAETPRFPEGVVRRQCAAILAGWGLAGENLEASVDALTDCDLRGIDTHGISLLALISNWMKNGGYDLAVEPKIEAEGPAHATVDAGNGLGFPAAAFATRLAVRKAKQAGIAVTTVRRSHHFGAAGYYARLAAREGVICLVATSTKVVCVVPPGGAEPVLGTNPLAYGIPTAGGEPIVFDMATSTAAGNKIRIHHLQDKPLPEGWVVDGEGRPVTDPHAAYRIIYGGAPGGLTALGATPALGVHKGYGLALLGHFLGGSLAGGAFNGAARQTAGSEDNIGHCFIAIDPALLRGFEAFTADVGTVAGRLRGAAPVDPGRPVLMPGDIENQVRAARLKEGVPLAPALLAQLSAIAKGLGVPFHLTPEAALSDRPASQ